MSFDKWRKRLAGEQVMTYTQPDAEDEGYYRKPITRANLGLDGKTNGQKRVIGWIPVAYFLDRGRLCGVIGDRDMAANEVTDEGLWSWVVKYPISEEMYRAVEAGQPWPDLDIPLDPIERIIGRDHNAPPEMLPEVEHAEAIDRAIGAAIKTVTNEAEAARALGSKNRIAELRLAADKAGKAIYEPIYREYKKVQGVWAPIVARAVEAEGEIQKAVLTFRESERRRIAKEQAEAAARQREIDEANQRAADRAIAAGEPEQPPVVEEVTPPAPLAPIKPTYGTRKAREEIKTFVEIADFSKVCAYFLGDPELRALLQKLAERATKMGQTVPGTTTRQGLI